MEGFILNKYHWNYKIKELDKKKLLYLYYKKDLSCNQIAQLYNICSETVRKRLYRFKIPIKKNGGKRKGNKHHLFKGGVVKGKCDFCHKPIDIGYYENRKFKYHFCNKKCTGKGLSKFYSGSDSRLFLKKFSKKYPKQFNKEIKECIKQRDKDICQVCGKNGTEIHHIDYNKYNISNKNLILLCPVCHAKTNFNRKMWKNYFINKKYNIRAKPIIMLVCGAWDLFHSGHLNILKRAREHGDYLIVGVSTSNLVKSYKHMTTVVSYKDRVSVLKELKIVDKVVKQENIADINQFKSLKADYFVLGDDWKYNYENKNINWLRDNNKIIWIPYTKRLSTSKIKKNIIKQSWEIASTLSKRKNG